MLKKEMFESQPRVKFPSVVYASVFCGTMFVVTMVMMHSHDKSKMDHEFRMKELEISLACSDSKYIAQNESGNREVEKAVSLAKKSKFW